MPAEATARHGLGRAAQGLRAAAGVERLVALRVVGAAPGATAVEVSRATGSTTGFARHQLAALVAVGLLTASRVGRGGPAEYIGYTATEAGLAVLNAARLLGEPSL